MSRLFDWIGELVLFKAALSSQLRRYTRGMIRAVTVCAVLLVSHGIFAQEGTAAPDSSTPRGEIIEAFHVSYPPIALAAHVEGDVTLVVDLRGDGTVGDVRAESGPQILRAVSIEGSQKNLYTCRMCARSDVRVRLTYSFKLGPAIECEENGVDSSHPRFTHSGDTITIGAQPWGTCDYAARLRARSAKCLFLWRCGWR